VRIGIITYCRREDGHPGGVPKWAWYLKRAIEEGGHEARHFCWRDYPEWERCDRLPEHEKARLLSAWIAGDRVGAQHSAFVAEATSAFAGDEVPLRRTKASAKSAAVPLQCYDRIIADGFWASGLPDDAPVTVVCHGTWAGLAAACGGVASELIEAQGEAYRRFPVVAVSQAAARQVERYHGARVAAIIPNGVDLGVFRPAGRSANRPPVALYAGKGYAKGEDIVREVARRLEGEARVEYLDAAIGMEARAFQRGDVFLFPSRHEGDSYALKEALACGLPVVASAVGALEDERPPEIGEVVEGFEPEDYRAAVRRVLANREAYQPRAWAERNASFRKFARRWLKVLERWGWCGE